MRYNPGYTNRMKTAISLPDEVFEAAEQLASELGLTRSRLYADAVADFVANHRNDNITEALNLVYSETSSALDPVVERLQAISVGTDEW